MGPEAISEPPNNFGQHLVPDAVAEAVVHRLEAIQVDDEQSRRHATAHYACVFGCHRLLESAAIRGAGQLVATGVRLFGFELRGGRLTTALRDQEHGKE